MKTRRSFRQFALSLVALLGAAGAAAAPVTVTGGFTSFSTSAGFGMGAATLNGAPLCPTAGCSTSLGPVSETFATPLSSVVFEVIGTPSNEVRFTPAGPVEVSGTGPSHVFLLGTLLFTNGLGSALDASFGFTLTTHSPAAALDNQTVSDTLRMTVTTNDFAVGTPAQNADFVWFMSDITSPLGSLRAFELQDSPTGTNTATAKVFGYIDSLHLSGFADATGGFIDPGIDLQPTAAVPEPETYALMLAGLGLLGLARARRSVRP
ncbi:MAG TPA: PEP-CTERM sorting domain-containing protein [Caldimonas sp.]|jgi:hypothetical protein|nr:PEP-CTERM sorting domain-containing protein [Caldimonas sp.]HEX2542422.1 PEP-CTERM sorting domain-containing protein [Caldimonas sp.]